MKRSFELGFEHGSTTGQELSTSEIEELHPDWDCDTVNAFMQGMLDGIAGDDWRLKFDTKQDQLF